MSGNEQSVAVANFISDMRAAIDKHADDAGRAINQMNKPADEISPTSDSDRLWSVFLAFHAAAVDWIVERGIKDDKVPASVMLDIGFRMFLDNTRDTIMEAERDKRKAQRPASNLRN